jgi:hypothetical protein
VPCGDVRKVEAAARIADLDKKIPVVRLCRGRYDKFASIVLQPDAVFQRILDKRLIDRGGTTVSCRSSGTSIRPRTLSPKHTLSISMYVLSYQEKATDYKLMVLFVNDSESYQKAKINRLLGE